MLLEPLDSEGLVRRPRLAWLPLPLTRWLRLHALQHVQQRRLHVQHRRLL